VTFGDVFGNCQQVMKLSRWSRGEAQSLDINNSESSYRSDCEHFPCRPVRWCRHILSLY